MSTNSGKSFTPNSEKNPINKIFDSVKNLDEDFIYAFILFKYCRLSIKNIFRDQY